MDIPTKRTKIIQSVSLSTHTTTQLKASFQRTSNYSNSEAPPLENKQHSTHNSLFRYDEGLKKGNRCDPNNYRLITVLPTLSKILEKAVHSQLYYYLNDNKIITSKQFGFRPKLSTDIALAHFTDNILQNMDSGCLTFAGFLDLSKAFDRSRENSAC